MNQTLPKADISGLALHHARAGKREDHAKLPAYAVLAAGGSGTRPGRTKVC
jgi:hypothetical protein